MTIYIQGALDFYKKLNKVIVKTDTKYILKNSKNKLKIYLGTSDSVDETPIGGFIKIPMAYPKKNGNFHLVRWVKSKDTIINLR